MRTESSCAKMLLIATMICKGTEKLTKTRRSGTIQMKAMTMKELTRLILTTRMAGSGALEGMRVGEARCYPVTVTTWIFTVVQCIRTKNSTMHLRTMISKMIMGLKTQIIELRNSMTNGSALLTT